MFCFFFCHAPVCHETLAICVMVLAFADRGNHCEKEQSVGHIINHAGNFNNRREIFHAKQNISTEGIKSHSHLLSLLGVL